MLATYGPTAMPVSVGWWRWDVAGPLPLVSRRAARDLWTHRNARFSRMVAVGCRRLLLPHAGDLWTHRNARYSRMVAVGCRRFAPGTGPRFLDPPQCPLQSDGGGGMPPAQPNIPEVQVLSLKQCTATSALSTRPPERQRVSVQSKQSNPYKHD